MSAGCRSPDLGLSEFVRMVPGQSHLDIQITFDACQALWSSITYDHVFDK